MVAERERVRGRFGAGGVAVREREHQFERLALQGSSDYGVRLSAARPRSLLHGRYRQVRHLHAAQHDSLRSVHRGSRLRHLGSQSDLRSLPASDPLRTHAPSPRLSRRCSRHAASRRAARRDGALRCLRRRGELSLQRAAPALPGDPAEQAARLCPAHGQRQQPASRERRLCVDESDRLCGAWQRGAAHRILPVRLAAERERGGRTAAQQRHGASVFAAAILLHRAGGVARASEELGEDRSGPNRDVGAASRLRERSYHRFCPVTTRPPIRRRFSSTRLS